MKNQKSFLTCLLFVLFLTISSLSVSAKDEWLQVRSKNFNLIGNASDKDIRKVATRLEQFRETFRQLFNKVNLSSPIQTNVIVFKSESAYKPFKPKRADGKIDNFVAGYFQPGEDVNYITLSTEGEDADTFGTIFHEYVHFMVDTNFGKSEVPPWFNEGLAEYYQTFAIEEDQKVKLGLPQNEHLYLLQQTQLIPLETLFKISNFALHQQGNHSRSIFYAESWALIHYLIQSGKSEGLGKFLDFSMKNIPQEKAFQDAFQTTYEQMEKDLKKYVAQNSYKYQMITFKNKLVFDGEMQTSPLPEAQSNAYLGDLLYHTNRADDAEEFLQKAISLDPNSSMANTTFGMVKMRQRKYDEAKNYLEKAVSEDQKNHLAFYRYAYLLSRDGRDEFGYVASFPADKTAKMRELLKKSIIIKPDFTESYELLAFVDLVNNEQLDEAVDLLQKALKYQPGNQRYALRIAEIYLRQNKYAEAAAIAEKIAQTADEPQVKTQAENLSNQLRERQEFMARQETARKQYENAANVSGNNGQGGMLVRRNPVQKALSSEELAKMEENRNIQALNMSLRKVVAGETHVLGQIQKIECKGKSITYSVKSGNENFALNSKDFQNLTIVTFDPELMNVQIGCDAKIQDLNLVLTYKPQADAKAAMRGELIAVEFVPKNFRFMNEAEMAEDYEPPVYRGETESSQVVVGKAPSSEDRREMMLQSIKNNLRQPAEGEKRESGFIEKVECSNKGMFFYLKNSTQTLMLSAVSPQSLKIRGFTPEIEQIQFGCGMKNVDIPVIFIYKEGINLKTGAVGELVSLEFVPKGFTLE